VPRASNVHWSITRLGASSFLRLPSSRESRAIDNRCAHATDDENYNIFCNSTDEFKVQFLCSRYSSFSITFEVLALKTLHRNGISIIFECLYVLVAKHREHSIVFECISGENNKTCNRANHTCPCRIYFPDIVSIENPNRCLEHSSGLKTSWEGFRLPTLAVLFRSMSTFVFTCKYCAIVLLRTLLITHSSLQYEK